MGGAISGFGALGAAGAIFWAAMLLYCALRDPEERHIWIFVILFLNIVGAAIYFAVRVLPRLGFGERIGGRARRSRAIAATEAEIVHLGEKPHLLARLALLKLEAGDAAEAERLLRAALAKQDDAECRYDLARVLHVRGDLAGAAALLRELVAKDRDFAYGDAMRLLARTLFESGALTEAEPIYAELVRTRPSPESRYHFAAVLEAKGDRERARAELDRLKVEAQAAPMFARRRERAWVKQAAALRRRLG